MAEAHVVILGGGIGGVVAANELHGRARDRAQITIVERNLKQSFAPSYLWVTTGERRPEAIMRDISKLERKGIEVIPGEVERIDVKRRTVTVGERELTYDYLIIALGAELAPDAIAGLEDVHTFYHLEGAQRLRDAVHSFQGGQIALVIASLPYKCPAAPYEGAMLLEGFFHSRRIRHKVQLSIYTPEPQPMPVAGPKVGEAVEELLAHKGIAFHPGHQLKAVKGNELRFQDGTTVQADLIVAVPPHRAPAVVRDAGLTDKSGWVPVDQYTLETKHENVFAIGDVTSIPLPDGLPLPKAGVFAHGQAEVVARNIAARILGQSRRFKYDGKGYCFLEVGGGSAGMAQGDFYAHPRFISLRTPSPVWHWGKVAFERYWLWKWY